jgi:tetratricopeptide (TPR) repeat protein
MDHITPHDRRPAWWIRALPCALLLAITAGIYINADHQELLFDSAQPTLLANPARNGQETLSDFWKSPLKPGQQVTYVSFAVNYAVNRCMGLDGLDVSGLLAFNVLLHGLNACLVYLLLRALLRQIEPEREPAVWIPAGLALLFAVHPIQSAGVAYIIQRRGLLATLFYLLAILAWLRARRARSRTQSRVQPLLWGVLCLICYWLAYRSKEVALTLPLTLLLIEFGLRASAWSASRFAGWLVVGIITYVAAMFAGLWAIGRFQPADMTLSAYGEPVNWGVWAHLLTMCRALLCFWRLLLVPLPAWLCFDHDFAVSHHLGEHAANLALLIHAVLIGGAFLAIRRGLTLGGLGILWFYAVQIPYMLLPQWETLVEYKAYLPAVGVALVVAQACLLLRDRVPARIQLAAIGVVALLLAAGTVHRNTVFRTPCVFWADAVSKSPGKFRPVATYADALAKQGRMDEAFAQFKAATRLADADQSAAAAWKRHAAHHNFGCALLNAGRLPEAIEEFTLAAKAGANDADTMELLGDTFTRLNQFDAAIYHYDLALKLRPDSAGTHLAMANAMAALRQAEGAEKHYREALRLNPNSPAAHSSLAKVLSVTGRFDEALQHYEQALKVAPDLAEPHKSMADLLYRAGRKPEAIEHYRRALQLDPNYPEACNNLANVLTMEGGMEMEAIDLYERAVKLKPDYVMARENLADLLMRTGRTDEAIREYQQVLAVTPNNERVRNKLAALSQPAQ